MKALCKWYFFACGLFLPTQLGKHWWPDFALHSGVRIDYLAPTIYFTTILLLFGGILLMGRIKQHINKKVLGLFFAILVILIIFSQQPILASYRVLQYLTIIGAYLIMRVSTHEEQKSLVKGLLIGSVIMLLLVVQQLVLQRSLQGVWWIIGERRYSAISPGISTISVEGNRIVRPYGTFSHPNTMGGFYSIVSLVLFSVSPLLAIPAIGLTIMSFSRIAIITLGMGLFILWWRKRPARCVICRLVPVLLLALFIIIPFMWKGNPSSLVERFISWKSALVLFKEWPGILPQLGRYIVPLESLNYPVLMNQPVHNSFIVFLLEWRIVSIAILYALWRYRLVSLPLLLAVVIATLAFFDHYFLTQPQMMLLLGGIMGYGMSKQTINEKR